MRPAIRVCLLADTHGQVDSRIAELARDVDRVAHAGDVGDAAVLEALAAGDAEVIAVQGNNDTRERWRGDPAILRGLPREARMALPGGELVVVHGDAWPAKHRHRRLRAAYPEARAVVYGHSHRLVVDDGCRPWILNPGAAGRTRTYGGPACLILEARHKEWRVAVCRFEKA